MNALAIALACLFALAVAQGPVPVPDGHIGECRHTPVEELVKIDQVRRHAFGSDKAVHHLTSWHGDESIYCVIVENVHPEGKARRIEMFEGGPGHHFITLLIEGFKGKPLDYTVAIYASPAPPPRPPQPELELFDLF